MKGDKEEEAAAAAEKLTSGGWRGRSDMMTVRERLRWAKDWNKKWLA